MFKVYEMKKDAKLSDATFIYNTTYASNMVEFIQARRIENPENEYIMILERT
jgi:hypothetical protein